MRSEEPSFPTIYFYHARLVQAIKDNKVAEVQVLLYISKYARTAAQLPVSDLHFRKEKTDFWGSAYSLAAREGLTGVVKLFCQHQIPQHVEGFPYSYLSPLQSAVMMNHIDIVRLLLENRGPGPLDPMVWLDAPRIFMQAVASNRVDIAKVLIEAGAPIEEDASLGLGRPLQLAAYLGNLEMVMLLKSNGADLHAVGYLDGYGYYTAQAIATHEGHEDVVTVLREGVGI